MGQEERKILRLFTIHGGDFSILTRMPVKEIEAEISGFDEGNDDRVFDNNFMRFAGLTDMDEPVSVNVMREHLSGYIIKKHSVQRVQPANEIVQ